MSVRDRSVGVSALLRSATRGDFLEKLGRGGESATPVTAAIAGTENEAERLFLRERLRGGGGHR